jgi:hypothetical protein
MSARTPAPIRTSVIRPTRKRCPNDDATILFMIEGLRGGRGGGGKSSVIDFA